MKEFDQPPLPPLESTYPRIPAPKRRNFHGSLRFIQKSLTPVMTITFVFTAVAIYLVDGGQDVSMTGLLGASFGSALGVALSMFVANKLWTIRILPRGLYTYNGMGTCATLPWETLSYAGILKLFGLRYFRFRCQGFLFAYLVPVELDHPQAFLSGLCENLPPGHPVIQAVQDAY